MAGNPYRTSTYSNPSSARGGARTAVSAAQHPAEVSTTTLLNALYATYTSSQPYHLDASTSLVVNTWLTVSNGGVDGRDGGIVDTELAARAWEHARRRAEDGCVVLGSLHNSTPSLLSQFVSAMPMTIPPLLHTALSALKPFLHAVSPHNPSSPHHSALAVTLTLSLTGNLTEASIALTSSGIDTSTGLLNIPSDAGYRAFDVFYYLLTSASTPAEREFLGLEGASSYALLNKSGTYDTPRYVPAADDTASADDFRKRLKSIGITGSAHRNLLSVLTGLLKLGDTLGFLVDAEVIEEVCEDVGGLLGIDPEVLYRKCSTKEREDLVAGVYEALVDWVITKANQAIANEMQEIKDGASSSSQNGDTVSITVVEVPVEKLGKAIALRGVFEDSSGINAEMKEDGVEMPAVGSSVLKEMTTAIAEAQTDLPLDGKPSREREYERDRREGVLQKIGVEAEAGGFLREILYPVEGGEVNVGSFGRLDLPARLSSSRIWYHLTLHPTDDSPGKLASLPSTTSAWSAGTVSRQLRAWRLSEWANRRNRSLDFTADFDIDEFYTRYSPLGCKEGRDGVESWILERGWSNGEVVVGKERVWVREGAWWEAEGMLDLKPTEMPLPSNPGTFDTMVGGGGLEGSYSAASLGPNASGFFGPAQVGESLTPQGSRDQLVRQSTATLGAKSALGGRPAARSAYTGGGDFGLGTKGDDRQGADYTQNVSHLSGPDDPEFGNSKVTTQEPVSVSRRIWVGFVWAATFWVPSFMLRFIGRMKRPDVRMAWREKLVLVFLIFLLNATVVFYIIEFGRLLCPNYDKAWSQKQVSSHQGDSDFWVSHHGKVYDISKFWRLQHSDTNIQTTASTMQPFAGLNLDEYIVPPLTISCPHLVTDESVILTANTTADNPAGLHPSGPRYQPDPTTALHDINWYPNKFLPRMQEYYKGDLVWEKKVIANEGQNQNHQWFILRGGVYDLKDYFHTLDVQNNLPQYHFFPEDVEQLMKNNFGTDITDKWESNLNFTSNAASFQCLTNAFYVGKPDFRNTPRCQVNNYILLAFTIVLCTVILVKFLAALQLGTKRRPAPQDKFVICQVPAYTEGENSLRKALDSLTALQYDNKRKLICVICDGMIVGGGNDRPTPKIVLDILGVDPKIDPPALQFKSVGQGNEQLNYGKVYSGLYEYEGNVVPYIVVVKVGKETEQSKAKPGNRGKRDSQILLLSFLNRVHHRSAMSPLELEMFHQINNIIGVDPELYEYVLMVDADTSVKEDSLNRLVASCANDAKIAGICGETSLENEERTWWTMIQVYEYYISHHLAKAFESLFGSVTCLPGCFCMYRLRTADKGRPLIISDKIINEYADGDVDTLHKKNLLSLGEDRYLTTLMTKHFPYMSYKFVPDAYANTAAPETWSVLLSQRRRWINSTIHNLVELVFLPELCGFCCFSMRFVVFIDLFGTLILPATCTYLGYLIYKVATHSGQFPLISIVMIAAVYGLQAIIFIIKRQWQHVGWMIIYIIAFPVYSFILPIYSFWNQDNFSWGNTRIVIGEKGHKQVISLEDEVFDPSKIPLQTWNDYALAHSLPGRRGVQQEKGFQGGYDDGAGGMEMEDIHSVYSSVRPASTILAGFPPQNPYPPPQSPAPFNNAIRQSHYSDFTPYADQPPSQNQRVVSMAGSDFLRVGTSTPGPAGGMDNMTPMARLSRNPAGLPPGSRPVSTMVDFQRVGGGPDDMTIVEAIRSCLAEVDLDNVTKKQGKNFSFSPSIQT
ncbi:hypothetical protein GP486_003168 [Trichoglossum hirsutum]|uniref:Chitin synthase A n=1 Tax=Trichoglossum hirsutum TaxID=265104 RepID=A0A9P8RRF3_9PEZI|nr:hypothetical protein GP486_003168 [Trichoglossum hirsutum]